MDWDQDGKQDILSGCYWTDGEKGAHLQILKGLDKMKFAASVSLQNIAGKPLQNVPMEDDSNTDLGVICTHQHAADYDGDGDLDLIVGCFGKTFFLYENLAEDHDGKNVIAESPVTLPIESTSNHAAPHLVDWDNDGDLDLLSGTVAGGVILSQNTGTRQEPQWAEFKQLVPPSSLREQADGDDVGMGASTRVWATDWNGDGWLDLLVGDNTAILSPAEGIAEAEWKRRRSANDEAMQAVSEEMDEFLPEYEAAMEKGEELSAATQKKVDALQQKMQKIWAERSEFQTSASTGHVWLLIRKPSAPAAETLANDTSSS
ncbi:MAG: FG-GAP repeat domain-containing protein [Rubripirellula sp.]